METSNLRRLEVARAALVVLAPEVIEEALSVFPGLTFTDDHAPVDTLVAPLFLEVEPTPPAPQP
jgi:hypothetical protein